jgi:hypothetical protein
MKNKFTRKIAKEIAHNQFDWTLDCITGRQDPDFDLDTSIDEFEQNFTEDLEEKNIIVTPKRIAIINDYYEKLVEKCNITLERFYSK